MKKTLLLLSLLFCQYHSVSAQRKPGLERDSKKWTDRIYTGGNFGLQFGNQTVVEVNPIIGYRINQRFSSGIGIKYLYYRYKDQLTQYSYETNIYGGSIFSRCDVVNGIFAYTEYELLNLAVYDRALNGERRVDVGSWFVGAGYTQPLGGRSSVYLMLLYNLTENRYTPYQNPIFRMGIGIGI